MYQIKRVPKNPLLKGWTGKKKYDTLERANFVCELMNQSFPETVHTPIKIKR